MNGKACLVTGATHGIGLVTARALAAAGALVLVHGRSATLAAAVAADIARRGGGCAVRAVQADFTRLAEVRRLAAELMASAPRIDVLINNAAVMGATRARTADGYDVTFAVNHLAPFLLTNLLLAKLTQSAPARVIVVASEAHRRARLDFGDLMNERVGFLDAYRRSKLANLLFARALAARLAGRGVTVNAVHPGLVASHLFHRCPVALRVLLATVVRPFMRSPGEGARTSVYLASAPELEGRSGGYYQDCRPVAPSDAAQSDADAARLWEESARLTGLAA
ncbi:MAG TPA: SDR family NAD(P)-dependent oxidoreductase [Steroidobacteraceae bacterium]|nr:SDR family NAD(P)-dependent oxidoreductase [Steroidobacteraceae bacterium]